MNVTYAGFIGSVTGMNAKQVSIGEMGGRGPRPLGRACRWRSSSAWRWRRRTTSTRPIAVFRDHPRTCEYYYVIADGKTGKGVGMEARGTGSTWSAMGESHPRLPHAVKDAVLLSAGDRYEELADRVQAGHGTFDAESARDLMDRPVAMKSNLHSVLFETKSTRLWVANASKDGEPAATQPYPRVPLSELLKHQPRPRPRPRRCRRDRVQATAAETGAPWRRRR